MLTIRNLHASKPVRFTSKVGAQNTMAMGSSVGRRRRRRLLSIGQSVGTEMQPNGYQVAGGR